MFTTETGNADKSLKTSAKSSMQIWFEVIKNVRIFNFQYHHSPTFMLW